MEGIPEGVAAQRKAFVKSINGSADELLNSFLPFVEADKNTDCSFSYSNILTTMSEKQCESLWEGLADFIEVTNTQEFDGENELLSQATEEGTLEALPEELDPDCVEPTLTRPMYEALLRKLQGIQGIADCLTVFLDEVVIPQVTTGGPDGPMLKPSARGACGPGFTRVAAALHDCIYSLGGTEGLVLQETIALICEKMWKSNLPGKLRIIAGLVPYLVMLTLNETCREEDIRRICGIRTALSEFVIEDENFEHLRSLLLQAFRHPTYLRYPSGRRFLSYVMTLSPKLVDDIHLVIKSNMPGCPPRLIGHYAEIYFRAWRESDGAPRLRLEHTCLQDYMMSAIHAAVPATFKICRRIIDEWIQARKSREVEAVLLRSYEAILWRSLSVANPDTRKNAATLLIDAFPLQNPDRPRAEVDECINKQIQHMCQLLEDPVPTVRLVAIQGCCRLANIYWDLFPIPTRTSMIKRIAVDLAHDASSAPVRATVLKSIDYLMECPQALPTICSHLEGLSTLLHDKSERVRAAFVTLLQRVNTLRDVHFYDIVDINDLLTRLVLDSGNKATAAGITKLLLPSYFPESAGGTDQYRRTVKFLKTHEAAALVFYSHLHKHAPVERVTKLILLLGRGLKVVAKRLSESGGTTTGKKKSSKASKKRGRSRSAEVSDSDDEDADTPEFDQEKIKKEMRDVAAITRCVFVLWGSIEDLLHAHASSEEALMAAFGGETIMNLMESLVFAPSGALIRESRQRSARVIAAAAHDQNVGGEHTSTIAMTLFQIAALLPASAVKGLKEAVWTKLSALTGDADASVLTPIAAVLCRWGQHDKLLEAAVEGLEGLLGSAPGDSEGTAGGAGSGTKSRGRKSKATRVNPMVALQTVEIAIAGNMNGIRQELFEDSVSAADATSALDDDEETGGRAINRLVTVLEALKTKLLASTEEALNSFQKAEAMREEDQLVFAWSATVAAGVRVLAKLRLHAAAVPTAAKKRPFSAPSTLIDLFQWSVEHAVPAIKSVASYMCLKDVGRAPLSLRALTRAVYDSAASIAATCADCVVAGGADNEFRLTLTQLTDLEMGLVETVTACPPIAIPLQHAFGSGDTDKTEDGSDDELVDAGQRRRAQRAAAAAQSAPVLLHQVARLAYRLSAAQQSRRTLQSHDWTTSAERGVTRAVLNLLSTPASRVMHAKLLPGEEDPATEQEMDLELEEDGEESKDDIPAAEPKTLPSVTATNTKQLRSVVNGVLDQGVKSGQIENIFRMYLPTMEGSIGDKWPSSNAALPVTDMEDTLTPPTGLFIKFFSKKKPQVALRALLNASGTEPSVAQLALISSVLSVQDSSILDKAIAEDLRKLFASVISNDATDKALKGHARACLSQVV